MIAAGGAGEREAGRVRNPALVLEHHEASQAPPVYKTRGTCDKPRARELEITWPVVAGEGARKSWESHVAGGKDKGGCEVPEARR